MGYGNVRRNELGAGMKKGLEDAGIGDKLDTIASNQTGGGAAPTNVTVDAAGRSRVSSQVTLLSGTSYLGKDPDLVNEEIGPGGSSTASGGFVEIQAPAPGSYVIRQTKDRAPYFSGKSQLVEFTFAGFDLEAGCEKEVGYFSSSTSSPFNTIYDGIRLLNDGSDFFVEIYNNGSLQNTGAAARSTWIDPLDGTGASEINYNFSLFTIIYCDFLYLGGSTVRLFIEYEGSKVLFFEYDHAGKKATTIFDSPNQPIRYGVRYVSGAGTFKTGCYAVSSEGAESVNVKAGSSAMGSAHVNANTIGTRYALKGLRLSDERGATRISRISTLASTNDQFYWELVLNPTIAGAAITWNAISNFPMEEATADAANPSTNTVTNGITLRSGYAQQLNSQVNDLLSIEQRLGVNIDGTFDEIWLVVTPLGANLDIRGSIDFDLYQ